MMNDFRNWLFSAKKTRRLNTYEDCPQIHRSQRVTGELDLFVRALRLRELEPKARSGREAIPTQHSGVATVSVA